MFTYPQLATGPGQVATGRANRSDERVTIACCGSPPSPARRSRRRRRQGRPSSEHLAAKSASARSGLRESLFDDQLRPSVKPSSRGAHEGVSLDVVAVLLAVKPIIRRDRRGPCLRPGGQRASEGGRADKKLRRPIIRHLRPDRPAAARTPSCAPSAAPGVAPSYGALVAPPSSREAGARRAPCPVLPPWSLCRCPRPRPRLDACS